MMMVRDKKNLLKIAGLVILLTLVISLASAGSPDPEKVSVVPAAKKLPEQAKSMAALSSDADVRVIVTLKETATDAKISQVESSVGSFKIEGKGWTKVLPNSFAATMKKSQMIELQKDPAVKEVRISEKVYAMLDTASYWSGVTKARKPPATGFGVTGDRDGNPYSYSSTDVVIAIVDTGIDPQHVDLTGTDHEGGTQKVIGWYDVVNGQPAPYDDNGHGTHVASIAAGEGEGTARYKGVAPGAALVGIKVLDSSGSGWWDDVIGGINWAVENKAQHGIRIMSLSLGGYGSSMGDDPLSVAVNNAVDAGLVVTVAAGNAGVMKYTISTPGAAANAITVAAMDDPGYLMKTLPAEGAGVSLNGIPAPENSDTVTPKGPLDLGQNHGFYLAPFSSRGPTADNRIKPDVAAPGVKIMAAKSIFPLTGGWHRGYLEMSGTSMSTPFVAGVAALMLDANYAQTPTEIKTRIKDTAEDYGWTGQDIDFGSGRIRAYRAVKYASTGVLPTATGDISVPTHLRRSGLMNEVTEWLQYPLPVTNDEYPLACTLIMTDWSGITPGVDFDLAITDPIDNIVAASMGTSRQETIALAPFDLMTYNAYVANFRGAGKYSLDCSYK